MISNPIGDVSWVLRYQLQIAGLNIEPISVKDLFVALVKTDDHLFWVQRQIVDHASLYLLEWSEIAYGFTVPIRDIEMKILVATGVADKQDIVIRLPKVGADIPVRYAGDPLRFATFSGLDPNV